MEIRINLKSSNYEIYIQRGILEKVGNLFDLKRKCLIITDNNIPMDYIEQVRIQCNECLVYTIKSGESSKSFYNYQKILTYMLEHNFSRNDLIIAIGGGVSLDLAGFVASTYKRGIEFINIPTSTLSMVDSSVGGKVAVNLNGIKNCVGNFHHPAAVFIDANTLKTLPKKHFYNGLVESVKSGLLRDIKLFNILLNGDINENIEDIIIKSLLVKKYYVEIDELDKGIRGMLNLGHTFGHALESYYNYRILHGVAVLYGMIIVVDNAEINNKLRQILKKFKIKFDFSGLNDKRLLDYIVNDKKFAKSAVDLIKIDQVMKPYIVKKSIDDLANILKGANLHG